MFTIALYTSDPNLLCCEVARLEGEIGVDAAEPLGAGWFADGDILLQRFSASARPRALHDLGPVLESDALLVHAGPLPLGLSLEENTQPFRFRQWLFAHDGRIGGSRFRNEVQDLLPDHLARAVRGGTLSELAFALFLMELRNTGRTDDLQLEPARAAAVLGQTARTVERLSGQREDSVNLFATNSRVLAAARIGTEPLYFRLLEGAPVCERCQLDGSADAQPAVRAHLRRKSVVIATQVTHPAAWIEVESGMAVGVGANLNVEQVRI